MKNPAIEAAKNDFSYATAEYHYKNGYMSEKEWRWFVFFWIWGCARFSNLENANRKQHYAFQRLGKEGLYRRFDRVIALRNRLRAM